MIISADDYFMSDGKYKFDKLQLTKAHGQCLKLFVALVKPDKKVVILSGLPGSGKSKFATTVDADIVVDNTNLSVAEIAPYVALSMAYGAHYQIIRIKCDPSVAFARCTHGVPKETFAKMVQLEKELVLPSFWRVS